MAFDVGGVALDRPFKIRRLGHFGVNVHDAEETLAFYTRDLGFRISDAIDFGAMVPTERRGEDLGSGHGYFLRHGTDHHSYVVFPKRVFEAATVPAPPQVTVNQLTWQVGSLEEVRHATDWIPSLDLPVARAGRDMPGSNWHVYLPDPDGHINELYYGIEQIGWNGYTKPPAMYSRIFHEAPELPQPGEAAEVDDAIAAGVPLLGGNRYIDPEPATWETQGVLLPRPFKVVRIGPVSLFVADVAASVAFYTKVLGLRVTETVDWHGHECVYLRTNTEHHSLAIFPLAAREAMGMSGHSTLGPIGLQVANFRQLRGALAYLEDRGHTVTEVDPALHPGIDYAACVTDPDGHTVQLYYYMEQVGWDGRPRPADQRVAARRAQWPEVADAYSDSYDGEPFLGPWG